MGTKRRERNGSGWHGCDNYNCGVYVCELNDVGKGDTMKRLTIRILAGIALFLLTSAPCWAGPIEAHPKFADIQTTVDTLIDKIKIKQADYFAIHKQYFQGLTIPDKAVLEMDGMTYEEIDEGLKPNDQQASWKDFDSTVFFKNATLPCHIRVDVYRMPTKGWGWVLQADIWHEGDHWVYQHDEGPGRAGGPWDTWYIKPDNGPMSDERSND